MVNSIIKYARNILGENIVAIIGSGSNFNYDRIYQSWSDIDLLLVLGTINFQTKCQIAKFISQLESKYKMHFGVNIITKSEAIRPIFPELTQAGKVLQALRDLSSNPERLLYSQDNKINFYNPTKSVIRSYSISNIGMFLLMSRRNLTSDNLQTLLQNTIRSSFTVTRLAIQAMTLNNQQPKQEIIKTAEGLFRDFDLNILAENLEAIKIWGKLSKAETSRLVQKNDSFIENFSSYIFEKLTKQIGP